MKIFVRSTDGEPQVVATYPDDADVAPDAHGDAQPFIVPSSFVTQTMPAADSMSVPSIKLASNWRESAKPAKVSLDRRVAALEGRVAELEATRPATAPAAPAVAQATPAPAAPKKPKG